MLSGSGGSCDVFSATLDGERVAIKIARDGSSTSAMRDLRAEATLLKELGLRPHRHIITIIGEGIRDDGRPFIVLELLAETLSSLLPKPSVKMLGEPDEPDEVGLCEWWSAAAAWPMPRALQCGYHLALALKHLHEEEALPGHRVLHRDLKPDNIGFLADGSSTLVLLDFGLASRWQLDDGVVGGGPPERDDVPRPLTGQTGSTRYMSPEVALSQPYSGKAEVFSFATILWQLVSHARPFRGFNVERFERRVARGGERPAVPRHWPDGLKELLHDCWEAEPTRRPTFSTVCRRLETLLQQQPALTASRARIEPVAQLVASSSPSSSQASSTSALQAMPLEVVRA